MFQDMFPSTLGLAVSGPPTGWGLGLRLSFSALMMSGEP